jgi:hypothetical protein
VVTRLVWRSDEITPAVEALRDLSRRIFNAAAAGRRR